MQQLVSLIPLILLVAVFYFLVIRPQSKQQKQMQEMRDSIKVGDEVLTIGGFYGVVYALDDKNVVLEMLPDFEKAMVIRSAISKVITADESVIQDADEPVELSEQQDNLIYHKDDPELEEMELQEPPQGEEENNETREDLKNRDA